MGTNWGRLWLLPVPSKIQHLVLSRDSLTQWCRVIVRESPGQLQTGERGQPSSVPVTVLKRQRAARGEMAPMAEDCDAGGAYRRPLPPTGNLRALAAQRARGR